jgi:C4-dicarboxylate-specific signal transduction histidine kinase
VALSALILAALFAERRESEARLAHAKMVLERGQDAKLISARAITASIAHEIRQPLTALMAHAGAAIRFLDRTPPSYDQLRVTLRKIEGASQRTSDVFEGLRSLFARSDEGREPLAVNDIVDSVLQSLHAELRAHRVVTRLELAEGLPLVLGHRGQLQEVMFNLIHNAIEAMESMPHARRTLRVRTELRSDATVAVLVQDTGRGIDPKDMGNIFSAFITTKAKGTGLGLAICRMIVESHGGRLTATSDGESGALFQFVLPTEPQREDVARAGG